jgi:hypothetical protein
MIHAGRPRAALVAVLLLGLIAGALAAGCGKGTIASSSSSPSSGTGSTALKVLALKQYVAQLTPIYNQVATTVGSLDGTVSGLSPRPDATWTASALKLKAAAAQLGAAASGLAAITPPASLQGAQSGLVAALQRAQKVLDTAGAYLAKAVYLPTFPDIKTQIQAQVKDALKTAWTGILDAVNKDAVPTPGATP